MLSLNVFAAATVASDVLAVEMISTSGSTVGGLKKCSPRTCSARPEAAASAETDTDDVFVARIASGLQTLPSSAKSRSFVGRSSTIASITRSQSATRWSSAAALSCARILVAAFAGQALALHVALQPGADAADGAPRRVPHPPRRRVTS